MKYSLTFDMHSGVEFDGFSVGADMSELSSEKLTSFTKKYMADIEEKTKHCNN